MQLPRHRRRPRWRTARAVTLVAAIISVVALNACSDAQGDEASTPDEGGKVTVAGDSISVGVGAALRTELGEGREVRVIGEGGTGLARIDAFDWPTRLEALARDFPPDVLVFSVASNDAQDLLDADGALVAPLSDDAAWDREYSARLARSFDAFEGTGTTVVWLGHVRSAEDRVGVLNRRVHRLAEQVAAERDWVEVRDLAQILGTGDEVATDCLVADGLHLSTECLERAAAALSSAPPITSGT